MQGIPSGRVNDALFHQGDKHWSQTVAECVLASFPNEELYTCAAGISPSGIVHFGNFRDVMTSVGVAHALQALGKNTRVLFSWDNYDRFRKVPAGVDSSWREHVGKPLALIPCPCGAHASYATHYQEPFTKAMEDLGISLVYRDQHALYTSGAYASHVRKAMERRRDIGSILFDNMSDIGKEEKQLDRDAYLASYYPLAIYSPWSGTDNTEVTGYDGENIVRYRCLDTQNEGEVRLDTDFHYKLAWKADWPMRWGVENVHFEPGGKDHASPGSSFDVGARVAREVFGAEPPVFTGYEFVGLQGLGAKMSGSKGNAVSPAQLLEIYEPSLLKWLYARKQPRQAFTLAFDTELYRQYDEFDRACAAQATGTLEAHDAQAIAIATANTPAFPTPIPFKQAVALGQILQWDRAKVIDVSRELGQTYSPDSLLRLEKARAWLQTYNPQEMIQLLESANDDYAERLSPSAQEHVRTLHAFLVAHPNATLKELEHTVYDIPKNPELSQKENSPLQRAFFGHVYQLLIGKDAGPRLSTFLWAANRDRVLALLDL
jgi:lysyl-tRNA synthetase class 1